MIGSSFQEYNFYQNWLNIVTKEFVSPIADVWRLYYDYDLSDSLYVDNDYCYRLRFFRAANKNLPFPAPCGLRAMATQVLKRIDATVSKFANLNFIEKIKIQQELAPTEAGGWLPVKESNSDWRFEIKKIRQACWPSSTPAIKILWWTNHTPPSFMRSPLKPKEDARLNETEVYWDSAPTWTVNWIWKRTCTRWLTRSKNIPIIRTYTDIIKRLLMLTGMLVTWRLDHPALIAYNNVEGVHGWQLVLKQITVLGKMDFNWPVWVWI